MAKVRTKEECLAAIQSESAWRKKELASLKGAISGLDEAEQTFMLRAAIVMVYAHWEGFVCQSSSLYLDFVNEMVKRNSIKLSPHFEFLTLWKSYRENGSHAYLKNPVPFIKTLAKWKPQDQLLPVDVIDSESNLNSKVLKRIINILDLDFGYFESKQNLIDENLLRNRNEIAHGKHVKINYGEYNKVEMEVRDLFDNFQNLIEKTLQTENYKAL